VNWLSFTLAILAVVVFLSTAYTDTPKKWQRTDVGLALLTLAWMAQLILITTHHVTVTAS
jgi:hypothetical protein